MADELGDQFPDRRGANQPGSWLELDLGGVNALAEPENRVLGVPGRTAGQAEQSLTPLPRPGAAEHAWVSQLGQPGEPVEAEERFQFGDVGSFGKQPEPGGQESGRGQGGFDDPVGLAQVVQDTAGNRAVGFAGPRSMWSSFAPPLSLSPSRSRCR